MNKCPLNGTFECVQGPIMLTHRAVPVTPELLLSPWYFWACSHTLFGTQLPPLGPLDVCGPVLA